jgi:hypothetical protein
VRYPGGLRGAAFGGAAAISAEGDAEGKVSEVPGQEEMTHDESQMVSHKSRRIT